ncbi:MAG: N-acetyltransferase [Pseudomonadota bacterium]
MSLDAINIRPAETADAKAITRVHDEAWRGAYRGIIPGVALERMVSRRGPDWWRRLIVHQRGILTLQYHDKVVGYVTMGANRSRSLRVRGEVYELYVAPAYQGLGFGSQLFKAARRRLRDAKLGHFVTWVLEENEPAVRFYRAMGGEPVAHGVEQFGDRRSADISTIPAGVGECRKLAFVWGGSVDPRP